VVKLPTAVQAVEVVHETALSRWLVDDGSAVDWIVQVVPFHASASVRWRLAVPMNIPTPVHVEAVEQDTPRNSLTRAPVWFGVVWTPQLVPFQRSASIVGGTSMPVLAPPTAVQAVAAVHETPESWA
jgi:hypothetical protein